MYLRSAAISAALLLASSSAALADNFYVGAYAGPNVLEGHATTTTIQVPAGYFASSSIPAVNAVGSQGIGTTGANFGALAGYTWQLDPHWFTGIEVDFGVNADSDMTAGGNTYPCCAPSAFAVSSKVSTNWLFTARPRLGYAWDHWAAYVTGGLALTDRTARFQFSDTFAAAQESARFSDTAASWTLGAGLEDRLSDDWTWRLEYLYADFNSVGGTSTNLTAGGDAYPASVFTHAASLDEHLVRFALTYNLH
jgi:outer membrane immunogenic protein